MRQSGSQEGFLTVACLAVLYETENGTRRTFISNAWGGRDLLSGNLLDCWFRG